MSFQCFDNQYCFYSGPVVQNGQTDLNMRSLLLITCIPIESYLHFSRINTNTGNEGSVAAAGGMAGVCVPLCVMDGNFAPMRALLSALRSGQTGRGEMVAALPPPTGHRREKCSNTCRRFPSVGSGNAIFTLPTTDQEVQTGLSLGDKEGGSQTCPLWRIGPFEAQGNNNGLRLRRELTAGDARESRTGLERLEPGQ